MQNECIYSKVWRTFRHIGWHISEFFLRANVTNDMDTQQSRVLCFLHTCEGAVQKLRNAYRGGEGVKVCVTERSHSNVKSVTNMVLASDLCICHLNRNDMSKWRTVIVQISQFHTETTENWRKIRVVCQKLWKKTDSCLFLTKYLVTKGGGEGRPKKRYT